MLFGKLKLQLVLLLLLAPKAQFAQELKGFLYGTVTLKDNKSYTGQIRWDNEAGSWDDIFEAYKNEPQIQEKIKIQGYEENKEASDEVFEFSFMKLWENKESKSRFAFKCFYGNIDKIIHIKEKKYATVQFKDGKRIKLRRRGNDIGEDIKLFHYSLGNLEFEWENIKEISFSDPPANLKNVNGSKIFGKLLTAHGILEGYIVWDYDEEAYDMDIINGYSNRMEVSLKFKDIKRIRPERDGAIVYLKNGTEIYLRNSSDVNRDNDGIVVKTKDMGNIKVDWNDLIHIDFVKPRFRLPAYSEFGSPKPLSGKVELTSGKHYSGKLVYDLDETWNIEILDGRSKGLKYYIPFTLIKKISPQNYNYCMVEFRNGEQKLLGEEGDVNHRNNGILVWLNESKTKYIPWKEIKSVTFNTK